MELELLLLLWLSCGVICYFIVKSKGYSSETCLLHGVGGFFLGFIWLIVDICKKPYQQGTLSSPNVRTTSNPYDDLEKLSKLHTDGVLTDEEFAKMKTDCLNCGYPVESACQTLRASPKKSINGNKPTAVLIVSVIAIFLCVFLEIKNFKSYDTLESTRFLDAVGDMFYSGSTMDNVRAAGKEVKIGILIGHAITAFMAISGIIGIVGRKNLTAVILSAVGLGIGAVLGFCNCGNWFFWDDLWIFPVACAAMSVTLAVIAYSSQKNAEY